MPESWKNSLGAGQRERVGTVAGRMYLSFSIFHPQAKGAALYLLLAITMASIKLNIFSLLFSQHSVKALLSTAAGRGKFIFAYIVEKPWVSSARMIPHDKKCMTFALPPSLPFNILPFSPQCFFPTGFGNHPSSCFTFFIIIFKINVSSLVPPFQDLHPLF